MRYGINSGLKYFIWFCLLIGGVFWVDRNIEHRLIKREMLTLSVVLLIIVTITNIVSLALLISKYNTIYAVSYTHLDVYKRQPLTCHMPVIPGFIARRAR